MKSYDVAIIGAGPAGMAAAVEVRRGGLSAIVLDEQPAPGGQIYRGIEQADDRRLALMGKDYAEGRTLAGAFRASGARHVAGATVWNVDSELAVDFSRGGGSTQVTAKALVVASGAVERPMPLPGWTLPGVMTAGGLQILLKAHGLVGDDVVLVGCGPLLWLVASQMVAAGTRPRAIVETVPRSRYFEAARHVPAALRASGYLRKGFALMRAVRQAGVPVYRDARDIAVEGQGCAEAVRFTAGGRQHRIETGTVALHQGVVPNQQVTRLLRCEHAWSESQRCFVPVLDANFETSVPNVYVAGDGAGIGGAAAAALRGRLVGGRILEKADAGGAADRDAIRAQLARDAAVRPLLEALYAPAPETLRPADQTIVCRCEEVTAGQIRAAVALGAPGPNQVKSFLRAGMGPCQGRVCGLAVTEIVAAERGESPGEVGYYRIRPPLKPLPLAELAAFDTAAEPADA